MTNILRIKQWLGRVGIAPLATVSLTAMLAAPAVGASPATLLIERNDAGSVIQAVRLEHWSYNAAKGVLKATSRGGIRRCGAAMGGKQGAKTLLLDGVSYALDSVEINRKGRPRITVRPSYKGLFPTCHSYQVSESSSAVETKGAGGLNFQVDVLGSPTTTNLNVASAITYDPSPTPTLSLTLADDVLCLQDSTPQAGVVLSITDSNNNTIPYAGWSGLSYAPFMTVGGSGQMPTVKANSDGNPQCAAIPLAETVVEQPDPPAFACDDPDVINRASFEASEVPLVPSSDGIQLDFRLVRTPVELISGLDSAEYELTVTNCGAADTSSVVVRDFFSTSEFDAGTSTCTPAAACAQPTAYVDYEVGLLPAFDQQDPTASQAVISVTRPRMLTSGSQLTVAAAAIDLAESNEPLPDNNVGQWTFQTLTNQVPDVNFGGTTADPIDEDQGTVQDPAIITGLTITISDSDGTIDPADVTVTSLDTNIVTVVGQDITLEANGDITVTNIQVVNEPDAYTEGIPVLPARIRVAAIDNRGATGESVFDLAVNPVNDPPKLTVLGGFDPNGAPISQPIFTAECDQDSPPGCADHVYPSDVGGFQFSTDGWIVSVTAGAPFETEGAPTPVISNVSDPDGIFFCTPTCLPMLDGNGGLEYVLSGNSGEAMVTVTADDLQAENNVTTIQFRVVVQNSPPVVDGLQSFSLAENTANLTSVGVVTASDPETDPLQDWAIVGGNVDVDSDTNLPFVINPATGEITVNDSDDLDFDGAVQSFTLSVTVDDNAMNTSNPVDVVINLTDENDIAPTVASGLTFSVAEGSLVCPSCRVTATDPDTVGSLQGWTIVSGNDDVDGDGNFPFNIVDDMSGDLTDGVIGIVDDGDLDFERQTSFTLQVTVGDGANTSDPQTVTIDVTNTNDNAPVVTSAQVFSIDENSALDTPVGTPIQGSDPDGTGTLQDWAIVSGNVDSDTDGNGPFALDPSTGQLSVNDPDDLDFETISQYTLRVTVSDGTFTSAEEDVTVNINDLAE
ncbi:MAG: cadherin domain-containing protein [Xanthomonadales bacterium]|nr:cadherin domain-containing protein [Xanthomonadales bacterium]